MKKYQCTKSITFKSFPSDHHVEEGEVVEFMGYMMGDMPTIQLDPVKHPSEYKHLTHCSACMEPATFEKHFKAVKA